MKVILITGASSGIGFDAARQLAGQGHKVYAAARRVEKMEALKEYGVMPLFLDVTDEESCRAAVQQVLDAEGRIDVLVNNAGFGFYGAIENVEMEDARRQLDVNVFGLASLCRKVLPAMRAQGSGRIINIASVAGHFSMTFGGWYCVSKYSVQALSDALRMEVKSFGIDVSIIDPSAIRTPWGLIAADNLESCSAGTVYETRAAAQTAAFRKYFSGNYFSGPSAVTKAISKAVNARRPRVRYYAGRGARTLVFLHAVLPARWWDYLVNRFTTEL